MSAAHSATKPDLAEQLAEARAALARAQAAADTAAQQLEQLADHPHEGVLLIEPDGTVGLVNAAFCALWSLPGSVRDWLGRPAVELLRALKARAANPAAFAHHARAAQQRGTAVYEELIFASDGRVLERDFVPLPGPHGGPGRQLVRLRDVTARLRAAEALRAAADLPAQNPNPIFRLAPSAGRLLYANPAAEALKQALAGPDWHRLRTAAHALAADALALNRPQRAELAAGDGYYEAAAVPHPAEGYANLYLVDVSARVRASHELEQAKEAAEAAAQARENFLANVSHEIRTPLNGVLGMAGQLAKTPLQTQQHELLQVLRASGQQLLGVVNDLLDMAKITAGKLTFAQTAFDLRETLNQALEPLALQAREQGLAFAGVPLPAGACPHPWVLGDPHRLNQVLLNLVSNALKFTPAGGRVAVAAEPLAETDATLTVRFSVQDTGIGIAAEKLEAIFEGFAPAYAAPVRRFGGAGLGLSIARALVEQLGSTLEVASTPGRGSTFAFTLALPKAPQPAGAPALPYDAGALRGRRMLLVEDNETNRAVARLLLAEWGVQLDEAPDGPQGLALAADRPYDAVLMDIQLPGLSGLEVTAAIRALPDAARARVPILALTANAFPADSERYLAAGLDACLAKPFEEEALYCVLAALLMDAATVETAGRPAR